MIYYAIYFNRSFAMAKYGMLLGLVAPHHNMEVAIDVLINPRIMVQSKDDIGEKVFGIVESICQHICYEEHDRIKQQLITLLSVGNKKIQARQTKTSRNKRKKS